MAKGLTEQQRKFAQNLVKGMSQTEAYLKAGYKVKSSKVAAEAASRLSKNVQLSRYVDELRAKVEDKTLLTIAEKRAFLANLIRTPVGEVDEKSPLAQEVHIGQDGIKIKMADKLRALDLDSKLAGDYAPQQVELTGSLVDAIRGGSK